MKKLDIDKKIQNLKTERNTYEKKSHKIQDWALSKISALDEQIIQLNKKINDEINKETNEWYAKNSNVSRTMILCKW